MIENHPRRGEIWRANLGGAHDPHWVVIISLDQRNRFKDTVLVIPFSSGGNEGPTTLRLEPGESGLPVPSCLRGHFITTLPKTRLVDRHPRTLSTRRLREIVVLVNRALDPDAVWPLPR